VPVLLVEAAADQIVLPETRCLLRLSLPNADCISLAGAGHTFLGLAPDSGLPQAALLQAAVLQWLERRPTP
jgi:alpha-beta hydrolase superfamily lysophospholipase